MSRSRLVVTKDHSPLTPDVVEQKYYAPGIGTIVETSRDGSERVVLLKFSAGS